MDNLRQKVSSKSYDKTEIEAEALLDNESIAAQRRSWDAKVWLIFILLASNIATVIMVVFVGHDVSGELETTVESVMIPSLPQKQVQFHWKTLYSSDNETEAAEAWDAIDPAHGHIAIDHTWAADHGWLASMSVPGDEDKGLYLLESYHQMHCLKIVRKVLHEAVDGAPLSFPLQHARHCLDYFRQFVICHADNTPLYTLGQHTAGDGQFHVCRDWDALRDYATENSACFRDRVAFEPLKDQFGHCDAGVDGVKLI